jgi:hypothetical protein
MMCIHSLEDPLFIVLVMFHSYETFGKKLLSDLLTGAPSLAPLDSLITGGD